MYCHAVFGIQDFRVKKRHVPNVTIYIHIKCRWGRINFPWGELQEAFLETAISEVSFTDITLQDEKCILDRRKNTSKDLGDIRNHVSCRALQMIQSLKI